MSRRRRRWAAVAMVALVGAGCSKATAERGGTEGTIGDTANHDQAVRFATCLRDHGVREFPDPDASGSLTIDRIANGSSVDLNGAVFRSALDACKDLEPSGFSGGKRSDQQQASALEFAQCVRDNGVKDFPDPTKDSPLIDTNQIPSAATSGGMSILDAASKKCRDFAAAAGVSGPR